MSNKSKYDFLKQDSLTSNNFYFQIKQAIICQECNDVTYFFDNYFSFDIEKKTSNSLDFVIEQNFETDYIYQECLNCGKSYQDIEHSLTKKFSILPKYLIFYFKSEDQAPCKLNLTKYSEMTCENTIFHLISETSSTILYKRQ